MAQTRDPAHDMRLGIAAIFFLGVTHGAVDEPAQPVSVDELIQDLGDERYPVRVRASYELWSHGDKAEEALKKAADSNDPEIALRARDLLRKVELGILPDSSPRVVALVTKYESATPDERRNIIRSLKSLRAWRQVLKLHAMERDPETLEEIASELKGVSILAAREVLHGDHPDYDAARMYLEMGRPEPAQLMSLADFHYHRGTLDEELSKAAKLQGRAGHMWRFALYSAAGQLDKAAEEAAAYGDAESAARLRLLSGDPLPWIRYKQKYSGNLDQALLDTYCKAVERMWLGEMPSENLLSRLAKDIKNDEMDDDWHRLYVMYALGDAVGADPLLARLSPDLAFARFEMVEKVEEAIQLAGLDPANPDYRDWFKKNYKDYLYEDSNIEQEQSLVIPMAGFLERRGRGEDIAEVGSDLLIKLAKDEPERFIDESAELFSSYATVPVASPVFPAVIEYAGDNPARWNTMLGNLFGDGIHIKEVWDSLDDFDEDITYRQRLDLLSAILGRTSEKGQPVEEWWEWIQARAEKAKKLDRANHYGLMLAVSATNADAEKYVEVSDAMRAADLNFNQLGQYSEDFRFGGYEVLCRTSLGQWDKVAEHWQDEVDGDPQNAMNIAYLAGSLRRAGDAKSAAKWDEKVARLALGDPTTMRQIGQAYATSGDFKRATEWWMRGATQCVDNDSEFYYTTFLLAQEAKYNEDWELASSLAEMQLLYLIVRGDPYDDPGTLIRARREAQMARALVLLKKDKEAALKMLQRCYDGAESDASLADHFFPALRSAGLTEVHDKWFEKSWAAYRKVIENFPGGHNTMNSAAWTASRSNRRLDEAQELVTKALEILPRQAAYLDTLGEVWFAKGNREKAVQWSDLAKYRSPGDSELIRQNDRFASGKFPLK